MLARFESRAATYDRENRFFDQDFEELRATKYLVLPVPNEFGGPGLNLAEMCREQRRLAYYAPATALAVNMHLYWIGVAADLWRRGDTSLEWILRDAAAGEIFAAATRKAETISRYCSLPPKQSASKAAIASLAANSSAVSRQCGHVSACTEWTPAIQSIPKIVHAFMPRDNSGYIIKETWDVLGMRATRSDDTVWRTRSFRTNMLPGWFQRVALALMHSYVGIRVGADGLCQRLLRSGQASLRQEHRGREKQALVSDFSRTMAYHPEVQHAIAQMVIELESIRASSRPYCGRLVERRGLRC